MIGRRLGACVPLSRVFSWDRRANKPLVARLKELEAREKTLKLVENLMGLDKVRSQLRMIALRRAFLQMRAEARAAAVSARGTSPLPRIVGFCVHVGVRDPDDLD